MLQHHVDRLREAGYPIVIATTTNEADAPVVDAAAALGVAVFRGSETDVLSRYAGAIRQYCLDVVVRVTSDCPLIDGSMVASGIEAFCSEYPARSTYVSNVIERSYPRGFDFEVMSAAAILEADAIAVAPSEREHVTPYVRNSVALENVRHVKRPADASHYRVTLDTKDDLSLIQELIENHDAGSLDAEGIIDVLDLHPWLPRLNGHIEQKKLDD